MDDRPWPDRRRLRALTRAAYTATAGHLEIDPEPDEPRRRRWLPSARAAVVAAAVLLVVALGLGLRAWAAVPGDPVPLPPVTGQTSPGAEGARRATEHADPDGAGRAVEHADPDGAGQAAEHTDPAGPGGASGPSGSPEGADGEPTTADLEGRAAATGATEVIVVDVAGQVREPGVVELRAGARVTDAVVAAGGVTDEAEVSAVNLARRLVDGEQVYVPRVGEAPPQAASGPEPAADGPGGDSTATGPPGPIDLNSATAAELEELPGVGPTIAQRIIEWREANGGFREVAELEEVAGIGPATMSELRELVAV